MPETTNPDAMSLDEALQANQEANAWWIETVVMAIEIVAHRFLFFTTDQVWALLRGLNVPPPTSNSSMGNACKAAKKRGYMEDARIPTPPGYPEDTYGAVMQKTRRDEGHAQPKQVYRSVIYRGDR